MKLDLTGKNIEITPAIQDFAEKKVKKFDKFFDNDTIIHVTFSAKKEKQQVDIRIEYKGKTYLAEEDTYDVYAGIDLAIDKLLGQIRKEKTKMLKNRTDNNTDVELESDEEE